MSVNYPCTHGVTRFCRICEDASQAPAASSFAATACSVRTCKNCGRRMPRKRGRAPEYCWNPKCQRARKEHRPLVVKLKTPRLKATHPPPATADELLAAYNDGCVDGKRPETMDGENNPYSCKSSKRDRSLAESWARGWNDGAESFCAARDKARNESS